MPGQRSNKSNHLFSQDLENWLKKSGDKTLAGLTEVFAEKSFAVIFLILMALPALPLPTGGITHITELITVLVSLELIVGRKTIWLPRKWLQKDAGKLLSDKAIERLVAVIRKLERFSRRRWSSLLGRREFLSILGIVILLFTLAAFVAPPFSGLDTLPALGVVLISLAIILEDILLVVIGAAFGIAGIALEITAGTALYEGLKHLI